MRFKDRINKVLDDILNYSVDKFTENIVALMSDINMDLEKYINVNKEIFLQIMQYINIALQNKDYMLLADILKYELLPIIKNEV